MNQPNDIFSAGDLSQLEREAQELTRLLDAVGEERLWGAPPSSDAEFLSALRRRLPLTDDKLPSRVFAFPRLVPVASAVCLALMVLIFVGNPAPDQPPSVTAAGEEWSSEDYGLNGLEIALARIGESESISDAAELADYLDVPALESSSLDDEWEDLDPLTDELLALSDQDLNEVLDALQETSFF